MKKLVLMALTLSFTFGAFAQKYNVPTTVNKVEKSVFQPAVSLAVPQEMKLNAPVTTKDGDLSISVATQYYGQGYGNVAYIIVQKPSTIDSYIMLVAGSGIIDSVATANNMTAKQYMQAYVADETWSTVSLDTMMYVQFVNGERYDICYLTNSGTDTNYNVETFTVTGGELTGRATITVTVDQTSITPYDAAVSFTMGENTQYYLTNILFSSSMMNVDTLNDRNQNNADTMSLLLEYYDYVYSMYGTGLKVVQDLEDFSAGDEEDGEYALNPATNYVIWAFPYNGDCILGTPASATFTTAAGGLTTLNATNVSVYPNPASDYVTVSSLQKVNNVEIVNTLGQVVYSDNTAANGYNINVKNFERGTYFVKVRTNGKVSTSKIIVK